MSRTIFSQLVPKGLGFIFFGLLEVSGKGSAFLGPLIIGILNNQFGTFRSGFVYLAAVFLIPLPFLFKLDVYKGRLDAERYSEHEDRKIANNFLELSERDDESKPVNPTQGQNEMEEKQIQKTLKINNPFNFDSVMEVTPDN